MSAAWTLPAFEALARDVRTRTGLVFPPGRRPAVETGVRRAMARARVADLDAYPGLVARDDALLDDLIAELTVPETYFFREPGQFAFLRRAALPDLLRRRPPGHTLRAWSAGCSTGEEAYSLAMTFAAEGLAGRSSVLATDLSRAALDRARRASYGDWSRRGPGSDLASPYLRAEGDRFVVAEAVRRAVTFAPLNLARDAYPSAAVGAWDVDLIFCRNVLIYLDRTTVRRVAARLLATLAPGGWLFTASSDPPLAGVAPFEVVVDPEGVFYRRPEAPAAAVPVTRSEPPAAVETPPEGPPPSLDAAREALALGDYAAAAGAVAGLDASADACALRVRALANVDAPEAERACARAAARHPLAAELHYLHAALLLGLGRDPEAARAARRALYLDRALAAAHLLLGELHARRGDPAGARRSWRNALDLCAARPADEPIPLLDGEPAGRLAATLRRRLDAPPGGGPRP